MEGTSSTTSDNKGNGGDADATAVKNDKTAGLLHEATQLLKTLRVPTGNPRLKVMQIGGLDQAGDGMVLLDSGATHRLRPARDLVEWDAAEPKHVQLANGSTDAFRLTSGAQKSFWVTLMSEQLGLCQWSQRPRLQVGVEARWLPTL